MNINNYFFFIVVLALQFISGCTADQHAQNLSKEILIQVVEYDIAVQQLSRTMKNDYGKRNKSIQKRAFIEQEVVINAITDRLTVEAVDEVVLHGYQSSNLSNYIIAVQDAKRVKELQYEAAITSYRAKHQALLNKLTLEQKELKTVKSTLKTLQSTESSQEQIQRLIPLLQAAYEELKNNKEITTEEPSN